MIYAMRSDTYLFAPSCRATVSSLLGASNIQAVEEDSQIGVSNPMKIKDSYTKQNPLLPKIRMIQRLPKKSHINFN
jgi:hypothetical protein